MLMDIADLSDGKDGLGILWGADVSGTDWVNRPWCVCPQCQWLYRS